MTNDERYRVEWSPKAETAKIDFEAEFWTDQIPYKSEWFYGREKAETFAMKFAVPDDYFGEVKIKHEVNSPWDCDGIVMDDWEADLMATADIDGVTEYEHAGNL